MICDASFFLELMEEEVMTRGYLFFMAADSADHRQSGDIGLRASRIILSVSRFARMWRIFSQSVRVIILFYLMVSVILSKPETIIKSALFSPHTIPNQMFRFEQGIYLALPDQRMYLTFAN